MPGRERPGMINSAAVRCGALLCVISVAGFYLSRAVKAAEGSKLFSSHDPQAQELLSRMTLDEKIGQMTQPEQGAIKDFTDIEHYMVGSVLSGGNSDPEEGNSL